jgi:hypothetical protein
MADGEVTGWTAAGRGANVVATGGAPSMASPMPLIWGDRPRTIASSVSRWSKLAIAIAKARRMSEEFWAAGGSYADDSGFLGATA